MTPSDLATLQVKLSYVGPQLASVTTVIITSTSSTPDMALFVPYRRIGWEYVNDESADVIALPVPIIALDGLIARVGTLPEVTSGEAESLGTLSFMMVNLNSPIGPCGFEAILEGPASRDLFREIRTALTASPDAVEKLSQWACGLDLMPTTVATDVTSSVAIKIGGVRLDRSDGTFVAWASIRNNGSTLLSPPLALVLKPATNLSVANASGYTCRASPPSQPYLMLSTPSGLAPGAETRILVRFLNPSLIPIATTTRLYSGTGEL